MNNFQRTLDNPHLLYEYKKIIVLNTQDDGFRGNRKRQKILYAKTKYKNQMQNISFQQGIFHFGLGLV